MARSRARHRRRCRRRYAAVPGGDRAPEFPHAAQAGHDRVAHARRGGRGARGRGGRAGKRGDPRSREFLGLHGNGGGKQSRQGAARQSGTDVRRRAGRDQRRQAGRARDSRRRNPGDQWRSGGGDPMKNNHTHGAGESPAEQRNFARLCVEHPHVTWVLLIGTVLWGLYGYTHMPQRKDPDIPIKAAMVVTPWPGASSDKVEELVTKPIERVIASNSKISKIESVSRSNSSVITFYISDDLKDISTVLDDVGGRLAAIRNLPEGAGPIQYQRDFGDTATLMLTVASPKAGAADIEVRAARLRDAIAATRAARGGSQDRASIVLCFPARDELRMTHLGALQFVDYLRSIDGGLDPVLLEGAGCVGADIRTNRTESQVQEMLQGFVRDHYPQSQWEPDIWQPFVVRNIADVGTRLASAAGEKYSCRELDDCTHVMEKALLATGRKDVNAP